MGGVGGMIIRIAPIGIPDVAYAICWNTGAGAITGIGYPHSLGVVWFRKYKWAPIYTDKAFRFNNICGFLYTHSDAVTIAMFHPCWAWCGALCHIRRNQ